MPFDWKRHLVCEIDAPEGIHMFVGVYPVLAESPWGERYVSIGDMGVLRERRIGVAEVLVDEPDEFSFVPVMDLPFDGQGTPRVSITPLTMEAYRTRIRPRYKWPAFDTLDEVYRFILKIPVW